MSNRQFLGIYEVDPRIGEPLHQLSETHGYVPYVTSLIVLLFEVSVAPILNVHSRLKISPRFMQVAIAISIIGQRY